MSCHESSRWPWTCGSGLGRLSVPERWDARDRGPSGAVHDRDPATLPGRLLLAAVTSRPTSRHRTLAAGGATQPASEGWGRVAVRGVGRVAPPARGVVHDA